MDIAGSAEDLDSMYPENDNADPDPFRLSRFRPCRNGQRVIFLFRDMEKYVPSNDLCMISFTIVLAPPESDVHFYLETIFPIETTGWDIELVYMNPDPAAVGAHRFFPKVFTWHWDIPADETHALLLLKEAISTLGADMPFRQKPLATFRYVVNPLDPRT